MNGPPRVSGSLALMDQYLARRTRFAEALEGAVAIIPGACESPRNHDVDFEFRQDSDFFFLTGFDEPDAVAIIDPAHPTEPYVLFVRPRDPEMEIWNGHRSGVEGAVTDYGADAAYPVSELGGKLADHLVGRQRLYYRGGGRLDDDVLGKVRGLSALEDRFGRVVPHTVVDPTPLLAELRLRKSEAEAALLRRAAEISMAGHAAAMEATQAGMWEYQSQAAMEFVFRNEGSPRNGYPSIVASGPNACVLHYTENDRQMMDGDLLLIDAAAEYGYFSADITRTFPVNGRFTCPQRALYEVVLAAHRAAIGEARVGAPYDRMHETAKRVVTEGLTELGLLPRSVDESLAMHHYRQYFMHGTGHWLGMDVHDAGSQRVVGEARLLEPGMSFTVEPGVYVDPHREKAECALVEYDLDAVMERRYTLGWEAARKLEAEEKASQPKVEWSIPEAFRGIGIRIEDDLLMGDTEAENLTAELPTSIDDVEAATA